MALPALVLPFIAMIFWALGGGQGSPVQAMTPNTTGLNTALPDARFKKEEETWDKLSLYENAARDSAEYETARENDPYFDLVSYQEGQDRSKERAESKLIGTFKHKDRLTTDANEEKVNSKLDQLYREINKASNPVADKAEPAQEAQADPQFSEDVARLESMMELMNEEQTDEDPEMKEIESMLEKILDIQHPERVRERISEKENEKKEKLFSVEAVHEKPVTSLLERKNPTKTVDSSFVMHESARLEIQNDFYGLDDETSLIEKKSNAISAVIHDTQVLVAGAIVRMRLLDDVEINGITIQKDQFVYGVCSINGERLNIAISSIRNQNTLLPVSLAVYDLDGLEGIYIPGAITRDAAKQATDDALQNVPMFSMDTSVGAQAASAGIEATKGLLSKKATMIKVTVKAGYQVFLNDTK